MIRIARRSLIVALLLLVATAGVAAAAPAPWMNTSATRGLTQDPPEAGTVRLMAVGDVMLGQSIGRRIKTKGVLAPWAGVKSYFDEADLVVANLECSISNIGTPWVKTFTFQAPLAAADSLVAAGVDAVTVANNHAIDYGRDAFAQELSLLDQKGVGHFGGGANIEEARAPLIIERNGLRIAFLGYVLPFAGRPHFNTRQWAATETESGLAIGTPDVVAADVAAAKTQADVVVVMVHGGIEYSNSPSKAQKKFDAAAINAGAALVIGAHPHVLQGYVYESQTLIAYSTGNFVFDRFTDPPELDTAILDVTLGVDGVESLNWIPIEIHNGFPRPANAAETARIMNRLKSLPPPS